MKIFDGAASPPPDHPGGRFNGRTAHPGREQRTRRLHHASSVKLFMLPKFTGIPPFTQADQGAAQFAKTFGYTLDYGGPTTASATDQVKFIDSSVARGYKGIFISADDPAVVTPALKRAQQNGVTVVSFDSDVLPAGRSIYVEGTSAAFIAQVQLDMLGSQIGYKGDFVILSASATDTNQVQWNSLLVQDLKKPKYAQMHLVTIINPPDDSTPTAVKYAQSILKQYPTIKGIIAPTTIAVAAAAQVVQQEGYCGKYVVTGLGDPKPNAVLREGGMRQAIRLVGLRARRTGRDVRHARAVSAHDHRQGQRHVHLRLARLLHGQGRRGPSRPGRRRYSPTRISICTPSNVKSAGGHGARR